MGVAKTGKQCKENKETYRGSYDSLPCESRKSQVPGGCAVTSHRECFLVVSMLAMNLPIPPKSKTFEKIIERIGLKMLYKLSLIMLVRMLKRVT
ncbi:hypothetical protein H5410_056411 [Solanum commersonii]|uniref:Uncharacterized protein n=1 Tax=Solanum commersonii TaxID=4109 RepID=A0A9J5WLM3_SOLCO|nr:hypothetical protein H5410_056411 [Solanum commersonii]